MTIDDLHQHIQGIEEVVKSLREENAALRNQLAALMKNAPCRCLATACDATTTYNVSTNPQTDISSDLSVSYRDEPRILQSRKNVKQARQLPIGFGKPMTARAKGGKVNHINHEDKNYRAVVRDKAQREAMEGFECSQCECFYKATGQHLPNLCDKSSKHKYFKPPPATPAGFWEPWSQVDQ